MANNENVLRTSEYRPCWVEGRRAFFHRWTDSARPVKPKGMEDEETTKRYQMHSVHGLVEFEDGTVTRVWPNTIQFADGGHFNEWDWETMERERGARATREEETRETDQEPAASTDRNCVTCSNGDTFLEKCEEIGYDCYRCLNAACACKTCENHSNYEPRGAAYGDT